MTDCRARPDRFEPSIMRCVACRVSWDKEDPFTPPCQPKPPEMKFASGLPFNEHFR